MAISLLRHLYSEEEVIAEHEVNENENLIDSNASIFTESGLSNELSTLLENNSEQSKVDPLSVVFEKRNVFI